MLDVDDLRLHLGQSLDLPGDLPAETFRQGPPVPRHQRRRRQGLVARFDVDAANALAKSYVRKLVTELSGGVFGYLDSVLERHSFDEFGELI